MAGRPHTQTGWVQSPPFGDDVWGESAAPHRPRTGYQSKVIRVEHAAYAQRCGFETAIDSALPPYVVGGRQLQGPRDVLHPPYKAHFKVLKRPEHSFKLDVRGGPKYVSLSGLNPFANQRTLQKSIRRASVSPGKTIAGITSWVPRLKLYGFNWDGVIGRHRGVVNQSQPAALTTPPRHRTAADTSGGLS